MQYNDMNTIEDNKEKILQKKAQLEAKVLAWNGKEIWYQERDIHIPGIASIETDDWGVRVTLHSEYWPKPITLSGRWDILSVGLDGMGAAYCGWYLCLEMIYPELGINVPEWALKALGLK